MPTQTLSVSLEQIDEYRWRIPMSAVAGMRVPGLVFADEHLLKDIREDQALLQVAHVACLPGIVKASLAMPDIHWGYGFPIGGVAAMDVATGVVSPGGVGYDINCGVRLVRTDLTAADVQPVLRALIAGLFRDIPCGVGMSGEISIGRKEAERVMRHGARWAVEHGYGTAEDVAHTESHGCVD